MYMKLDNILDAHNKVLAESGGRHGILNQGSLEGIIEFIKNDDYYPSFSEKLSYLVYAIASNHCFVDGNKRTAIAVGAYFLLINDYDEKTISNFMTIMENAVPFTIQRILSKEEFTEIITFIIWDIEPVEDVKLKYFQKLSAFTKKS